MIPFSPPRIDDLTVKAVEDALRSGWITTGPRTKEFERRLAAYCGVERVIALNSWTNACELPLAGLGIGPGDEVIVPSMTYVASGNAVAYVGADVVLVDSDPDSLNVTPELVAAAITPRTKAVIPVDLFGLPVDIAALRRAIPEDVAIVEDAAEALGARIDGEHVGLQADVATFSFFGNKTLTTGEGGMVICRDAELAERILLLRGQGQDPQRTYYHPVMGFNYRLTNMQAAVGLAQLERVQHHLDARQRVVDRYTQLLGGLSDRLHIPPIPRGVQHGNWMFTVNLRQGGSKERDAIRQSLADDGIETRPGFTPLHRLPMHEDSRPFPGADWISDSGICLPTHARLTDDEVDFVVARLLSALDT